MLESEGQSAQAIEQVRRECAAAGFDLVQPLQVGWYNAQVTGSLRLEDYGSAANLALVIGNTRALWEPFLHALSSDSGVPWHRVVNSFGEVSRRSDSDSDELQVELLRAEGVVFDTAGRIDLRRFRWRVRAKLTRP